MVCLFFYQVYLSLFVYLVLVINAFLFIKEIVVFSRLMYLMKRYHNFEYQRTKKSLILQMVGTVIAYSLKIGCLCIKIFVLYRIRNEFGPYLQLFCPQIEKDFGPNFNSTWIVVGNLICFIVNAWQLPNLILSVTVIRVKSSLDVLQGISKLDYLLSVSTNQRNKTEEIRKRQMKKLKKRMDTEETK